VACALADVGATGSGPRRSLIPRSHFTRIADENEVDARTVERDYVLTHVLAGICQQPDSRRMGFKGGTALRLCYFADYRFSADLDFSLLDEMSVDEALSVVRSALSDVASAIGFAHLALTEDCKRVEYVGPLGKRRDVKLDLAGDELVENTSMQPLIARYPDQPNVDVHVYTLEEIAAEKVRCVIQRLQARDLFDLNELFVEHGIDADSVWPTFERKAQHKNLDAVRFAESFEKRMPHWKARWDREMAEHVLGEPPAFNRVERAVRRALRSQLRTP
jgi:predicted nucleotidyltransferase component of viral defense system